MNWEELKKEIFALSNKIKHRPNIIVGITKGGIIPARLLATTLGIAEMYCINVQKVKDKRVVVTKINTSLKDKNILLVEDMLETGKSLIAAKQYLEKKGARVKTACLFIMPHSEIIPDFYLRTVKKPVEFPWEHP